MVIQKGEIEFNGAQVVIPFEYNSQIEIFSVYYEVTHENGFEIEKYEIKGRNYDFPRYSDDYLMVAFEQRIWYDYYDFTTYYSYKDIPPLGNLKVYIELRDSLGNGWPFEFEVPVFDTKAPRFIYHFGTDANFDFSDIDLSFLMNNPEKLFRVQSFSIRDNFFLQSSNLDCFKEDSAGNPSFLFNIHTDTNEYITEPLTQDEFFFGDRWTWRLENYEFVPESHGLKAGEKVLFVAKAEDYFGNQLNDTLVVKLK